MKFVIRKVLQLVLLLLAVSFLSFFMITLQPGSTAQTVCGLTGGQECIDAKTEELGLDKSIPEQYAKWLGNVLQGDLGQSARTQQDVSDALAERLPVTVELVIYTQVLALLVALPLALLAAKYAGSIFDRIATTVAFGFLSVPNFILAILLILVFAVELNWFPATGYTDFLDNPIENLHSLFLPAVSLAAALIAVYMRLLRTDLVTTLQEDYITMAKAKGMSPTTVLLRHAFKPSSLSLITVIGLNMGALIGGTFIIEVIFAINGIGKYTVDAIFGKDFIPVQAVVLVTAVAYVLVNFVVDLSYGLLDPRIRHARAIA